VAENRQLSLRKTGYLEKTSVRCEPNQPPIGEGDEKAQKTKISTKYEEKDK
jgi:hypothetical protein